MYEFSRIGVDPVIFTIKNGRLFVFLAVREKEPYKGMLELPGSLLRQLETARNRLNIKINSIFGKNFYLKQFHTFTKFERDPRERVISIAYVGLINLKDSDNLFEVSKLKELAFDHKKILESARKYLKENSDYFVKSYMPKEFPLNKLQEIYEIIEDEKYDNRNFRKKIISSNLIRKSSKKQSKVKHRPAQLYSY
ncbi:MAG: hypothetical protein WC376_02210 [Candidatus Nanoarchaeia archaeon]|jgi:8-oxo-dGTP diphosphatase